MWTTEILKEIRLSHDARRVEFRDESWFFPRPLDILEWFALLQAGWVHNGDPKKPHAKLHSGKCSTGFFLCKKVLKFGNLRRILAACLIHEMKGFRLDKVDGVFGAPYSSITLAADVADLLCVPNYIVEKGPKDENGKDTMVFKSDDPIPEDSILLRVEELITTLDSARMAQQAIIKGNPYPVQFNRFIGALVYRPPEIHRVLEDGSLIVPFIEREIAAWDPSVCPLCKAGSAALPPKGENWAKLVA